MIDAYAAGFIDADGSIMISKVAKPGPGAVTPGYRVRVEATNLDANVLNELAAAYGGSVKVKKRDKGSFFTRRTCYVWQANGNAAVACLRRIRPYLRIKEQQAWVALEYWEQRTVQLGRTVPLGESSLREGFYLAMKQVKGTV